MQVTVFATHRKSFTMTGKYCAGQILNCIMSVYDITIADLKKWLIIVKINDEVLNDELTDIPSGTVFEADRMVVFVTPKSF